jgi:hypothetical protein
MRVKVDMYLFASASHEQQLEIRRKKQGPFVQRKENFYRRLRGFSSSSS